VAASAGIGLLFEPGTIIYQDHTGDSDTHAVTPLAAITGAQPLQQSVSPSTDQWPVQQLQQQADSGIN